MVDVHKAYGALRNAADQVGAAQHDTYLDAMAHHLRELESMPAEDAQTLAVRYARDIEGIARSARRSAASPRTYRN